MGSCGQSWGFVVLVALASGLLGVQSQVTWGPGPFNLGDDDVSNHRRLHDLLRRAYFLEYGANTSAHALLPAIRQEIGEYRQQVANAPSLALAVAMAKYNFAWYRDNSPEMNTENVQDASELMYASIQYSGCDQPHLPIEHFFQRLCNARWPYAVMMFSELGRDYAVHYNTDAAGAALERAVMIFDQMKRLPYYAQFTRWRNPYDVNFNEEWFPGVHPAAPVWDKAGVPLALFLESNSQIIASELESLVSRGLFEPLHFQALRAEGQDSAPDDGRQAVELNWTAASAAHEGDLDACKEAPQTCRLLAPRPELAGCQRASAAFVRLRPGGALKPHFGAAPGISCQLALRANPGARMSVGDQTLSWSSGQALVFDDTFVRQEWHAGVKGDQYVLQVTMCHPCEQAQHSLYGPGVTCPITQDVSFGTTAGIEQASEKITVSVPFAASAVWAVTLPELAKCAQLGELCPPDTQHGGPNPLSALNTWNYAINNLRAALHFSGEIVDNGISAAIDEVQSALHRFLALPALEQYGPIVSTAMKIFEALLPWLRQQPPSRMSLPMSAHQPEVVVPSDGRTPLSGATFPLGSSGLRMPAVGFGTWKLEGDACYRSVRWALELGIRHIDTAEAYGNEADIGRAIKDSGIPRNEIFLTTKATSVPLGMADPSMLESIFLQQLHSLQTDYVDVYMLHAIGIGKEQLQIVWAGMEKVLLSGRAKTLGVSNCGVKEMEGLWQLAKQKPVYLQNIYKVYKPGEQITGDSDRSILQWAREHGMAMVGYSAINHWPHLLSPLEDPHVVIIAKGRGKTPSQILHRWCLQHGVAVIPKASSRDRIRQNSMLLDFELTPAEMAILDGLSTLSESTHDTLKPAWGSDVFRLRSGTNGLVASAGAMHG